MKLRIDAPSGFSFRRTVYSHGWFALPPFSAGEKGETLAVTIALPEGGAARIVLRPDGDAVALEVPGRPAAADARHLARAARRILNLDLDLSEFHRAMAAEEGFRWIAETGSGRLLRSASGLEDLVKLVLTTNCSWALTTRMVGTLVNLYGEEAPGGSRSFPVSRTLAGLGERVFRERVRTGYRAPLLAELSRRVARGEVDPEGWDRDPREPAEIRKEMMSLPGVGPYVAENLLKMLGRPHGLGLDSWMRSKYASLHHGGRTVTDRTIARRYVRFGPWAPLALWLELTRDPLTGDDPDAAWESLA